MPIFDSPSIHSNKAWVSFVSLECWMAVIIVWHHLTSAHQSLPSEILCAKISKKKHNIDKEDNNRGKSSVPSCECKAKQKSPNKQITKFPVSLFLLPPPHHTLVNTHTKKQIRQKAHSKNIPEEWQHRLYICCVPCHDKVFTQTTVIWTSCAYVRVVGVFIGFCDRNI